MDLERAVNGTLPAYLSDFYYDWDEHDCFTGFFTEFLHLTQGRAFHKKPFPLADWQAFNLIGPIVAWRNSTTALRRFSEGVFSCGRKNGKTETIAGLELAFLALDDEPRAENYSCSETDNQARKLLDAAKEMIKLSPWLASQFKVNASAGSIEHRFNGSVWRVIAGNPDTTHGFNPYLSVIDEYHTQTSSELKGVFETGTLARDQSMTLVFGTVGKDKDSPMGDECEFALKVSRDEVQAPHFFSYLCQAPEEADIYDEHTIQIANPGYPVAPMKVKIDEWVAKARVNPVKRFEYCWLILNKWAGDMDAPIPIADWDACADPDLYEKLKGRSVMIGMDLGAKNDLTAVVIVAIDDDGNLCILPWFFMPKKWVKVRQEEHDQPYEEWIKAGYIIETPGNVTDHNYIVDFIEKKLNVDFQIVQVREDPHQAGMLASTLMGLGYTVVDVLQTWGNLAGPAGEILRRVEAHKIRHPNNPVLNWMARNVRLEISRQRSGECRFIKDSDKRKIDGMIAFKVGTTGVIDELEELTNGTGSHYGEDYEIW